MNHRVQLELERFNNTNKSVEHDVFEYITMVGILQVAYHLTMASVRVHSSVNTLTLARNGYYYYYHYYHVSSLVCLGNLVSLWSNHI